jgi:citrate synthase
MKAESSDFRLAAYMLWHSSLFTRPDLAGAFRRAAAKLVAHANKLERREGGLPAGFTPIKRLLK